METKLDVEKLKKLAAMENEDPQVSTLDPQIRTVKYTMFPDPKVSTEEATSFEVQQG